jgi:hypothetical protein
MSEETKRPALADDLIWGVDGEHGIAAEMGLSVRRVRYLIEKGEPRLPVRKFGARTIVASRRELRRYLAEGQNNQTQQKAS